MTCATDKEDRWFDYPGMSDSTEFVLAVWVVAALGAAGLRWGASNAIEGLALTLLLAAPKIARAAIRASCALLKLLFR